MHARWLVYGASETRLFRDGLVEVGPTPDGWTINFRDPHSGTSWEYTYPWSEEHGGGAPCFIRQPAPSQDDLVRLAIDSPFDDEAVAAARLIARVPEVLFPLLDALERAADRDSPPWRRIVEAITWSGVELPMNRRTAIGQSPETVRAGHAAFVALSERAAILRRRAQAAVGEAL